MTQSLLICASCFVGLVIILRIHAGAGSVGLPAAYLFGLLLIHVPGAVAHNVPNSPLLDSQHTERGIQLTAIGCMCFLAGVGLSRVWAWKKLKAVPKRIGTSRQMWLFCLSCGWIATYVLSPIARIPTVGAIVD